MSAAGLDVPGGASRIEWSERVIALNGVKPQRVPDGAVYIGRRINMGGWHLASSAWENPYSITEHGLHAALLLYEADMRARSDADLRAWLEPLRGLQLACWCHVRTPKGAPSSRGHLCHGDVLVREMTRLWPEDG